MAEKVRYRMFRKLLKLPMGNPTIPTGDPASVQTWNPGPKYLRYRLLSYSLTLLPTFAVGVAMLGAPLAVVTGFASEGNLDEFGLMAIMVALGAVGLVSLRIMIGVLWTGLRTAIEVDMLRYTLTDQALRLQRGVSKLEEVTLSFANIQNVKLSQGPLQRFFGVADLVVETAGGGSSHLYGHVGLIHGVSQPDELRSLIMERVAAYKGSGLGEKPKRLSAPRGGLASPEAAALLAEIRDGLAGLARA